MSSGRTAASQRRAVALHERLLDVSGLAIFGEMTAGVAHELNQPLTAITNYAHACERLLANAATDPLQLREALQQIAAQAQRAADIVQRFRDLAARQCMEREPASLNAVVAELRELLETDARLHGVRLMLQLAPNLPEVPVDAGRIQHVVLNFVRNSLESLALRPTADATIRIRTSATAAADAVELAVSDNGPGLAPDAAQRVFDPFFSTKPNALGLGLAINRSIARAHRGSVGYRPAEPTGACFYIVVPVSIPE
jgi:two-component system, LuxR family, sensor kinase FixL